MSKNIILLNNNYYLEGYDLIILDCDGVILKSNFIKENNIEAVLSKYLKGSEFEECINFFNNNPGITREKKLSQFIKDEILLKKILDEYNKLNLSSLINSTLVEGVLDFLKIVKLNKKDIIVLSGGDQKELIEIFKKKGIDHYFKSIYGGPISKTEHFKNIELSKRIIFFGDSAFDFIIAKKFNIDFALIYGQTNQIFTEIDSSIKLIAADFKKIKIKTYD